MPLKEPVSFSKDALQHPIAAPAPDWKSPLHKRREHWRSSDHVESKAVELEAAEAVHHLYLHLVGYIGANLRVSHFMRVSEPI